MYEWRGTQRWVRAAIIAIFGAAWLCYLGFLLAAALAIGLLLCCAVAFTALVLRKPIRGGNAGRIYAPT
jgi:hypothetical protein